MFEQTCLSKASNLYVLFFSQALVSILELKPGQTVLDIGCGIGGGDFHMAKVKQK